MEDRRIRRVDAVGGWKDLLEGGCWWWFGGRSKYYLRPRIICPVSAVTKDSFNCFY